ncbi:hypothetical protein P1X15_13700 [Runella sp. MFBS21]|uniref:tetratricopeptide repeat protein n=1 Tax=Runella sp. MFBS21 TaxID=3034018 RepID=UPI0023F90723|nr:hypothetical protein [Runella sp. MFBS21]MDF7818665.1 hypothetical protein [Runella sp. MFBS21]
MKSLFFDILKRLGFLFFRVLCTKGIEVVFLNSIFIVFVVGCSTDSTDKDSAISTSPKSIPLCRSGGVLLASIADLPAPQFRKEIGNSHLEITTASQEAQKWFDQGLNHLHGFWHLEAYRAFQQVIKLDTNCAMGYWGMAMCQPGFGGDNQPWVEAIDKAKYLQQPISGFEKDLIHASEVMIKEGIGNKAVEAFRNLYKTYPDEPEAIAFAAIILRQYDNEATQLEVKSLLEKSLRRFPDQVSLMHYYVHVMELRTEFEKAKPVAEKMAKLAPNSPHLVHMPGHLYYLSGAYEKAIGAYQSTKKQENEYHLAEKIPFSANQNYIHNLHFLAVAQAEMADYKGALQTATTIANLTLSGAFPNEGAGQMIHYEGRILPALVHIRFRKWPQAVTHIDKLLHSLDQPIVSPFVQKYFQVMRLYCLGMEAITNNQMQEAIGYGGELSQLMTQFEQEGQNQQHTSEFKSINETYDIMSVARYELAGWIDNMDKTQSFNETAWSEASRLQNAIKYDEPPRLMYPIEESRARLHLYRGEQEPYHVAKQVALSKRPKSRIIQSI